MREKQSSLLCFCDICHATTLALKFKMGAIHGLVYSVVAELVRPTLMQG